MTKPKKPKKPKLYVRQPTLKDGRYVIEICDSMSPLATVVETVPAGASRESAWQSYRHIKKSQGRML